MRRFLLSVLLPIATHAAAPETLEGNVYHASGGIASTRAKWESTVQFGADGRFSYLKSARGSFVSNPTITLSALPADGTYAYTRLSDYTARVTLSEPGGTLWINASEERATSLTIELTFEDARHGEWSSAGGGGRFYLTSLAEASQQRLINVALRASVAPNRPATAGFVVPGQFVGARKRTDLLIRVLGPSLAQFGVTGTWSDPDFSLVVGPSGSDAHLADWSESEGARVTVQKLSALAGAFPLLPNSKDAVAIVSVFPGAYTIVCQPPAGDPGGEALIEIYFLP